MYERCHERLRIAERAYDAQRVRVEAVHQFSALDGIYSSAGASEIEMASGL